MDMNTEDIINMAIEREEISYQFYASLSKDFSTPKLQSFFLKLSVVELRHKALLEFFLKTKDFELARSRAYAEDITHHLHATAKQDKDRIHSPDIESMFRLAIDKESEMAGFYALHEADADSSEAKKMFSTLKLWELEHKQILEDLYSEYRKPKKI
jgi:rubrerythrin